MSQLLERVMRDEVGLRERLERERSKMTHEVFLMAESGLMPDERERRSRARAASARAWMTHIGTSLVGIWPSAPPSLGDELERWFADNAERLEVIELDLAARVAAGPVDDLDTRERRVDLGAAARWLMEGIGALCDPDGDGGPAFARRAAGWLDQQAESIADLAAAGRLEDPDDVRRAESSELLAHVRTTVSALDVLLPGMSVEAAPSV